MSVSAASLKKAGLFMATIVNNTQRILVEHFKRHMLRLPTTMKFHPSQLPNKYYLLTFINERLLAREDLLR